MIKRLINLTRHRFRRRHELSTLTLKMLLAFPSSFWSLQCTEFLRMLLDSQQWETILLHHFFHYVSVHSACCLSLYGWLCLFICPPSLNLKVVFSNLIRAACNFLVHFYLKSKISVLLFEVVLPVILCHS